MLAEFHDRLVRSLSVLFLPFLAVPFALGARRARQSLGIAVGLVVLVAYNQVLTIRSEEHTSELQSLMRISYAVFCLKKTKPTRTKQETPYYNDKHKIHHM